MPETYAGHAELKQRQLAAAKLDELIGDHYRQIALLRQRRDELLRESAASERYVVPRVSRQTDKQRLIAQCPRCRGQLDSVPRD